MRRKPLLPSCLLLAAGTVCLIASLPAAAVEEEAAPAKIEVPGLGDPGTLTELSIDDGRAEAGCVLRGGDAREQLVVAGGYSSGQSRDLTHSVTYEASPQGVVAVDETGLVTPLANGETTIKAIGPEGIAAEITVTVERFGEVIPINFPNQIVPIFSKLGCNSGGCHGKASGQNGFRLSLLGFEPPEDYEYLVKEARGRRLFPAAPDRSLLLLKVTNTVPHGGGARMERGSHEYGLLRRWIAQGMPYGNDDDPVVARIEVFPAESSMDRNSQQQITVIAHYSDGSTEDVTRTAQYDANDPEMAEATDAGLISTLDLTGNVAVMARYQGQVGVFRASIPLGIEVDNLPEPKNFIDELVFEQLGRLGIPPSAVCDDATFVRRVTLDIAGRLPTPEESSAFVADTDTAKRDKWIDKLLASQDYADYFAGKWARVLRNKRRNADSRHGTYAFHSWIRNSFYENKPYDQFVRGIVAASGEAGQHAPVIWYREVKDTSQQVEDTAQLFLGLRIQCARCHHHPFEKWSQQDYYAFRAFFSRVGRKNGTELGEQRIFHNRGVAQDTNPKTKQTVRPTGLGAETLDLPPERDPRHALVDWMADPSNPFFARALANRYWKHFFDRGIVDPEDDMRVTNPASNPKLLDALAEHFIQSGFDLKDLIRTVCSSTVYQLSAIPNDYNADDKQNFSRYYPKRLSAEVLLDAINQVTKSTTGFSGLPAGTRAVQLPDQGANTYFLTVFGTPQADTACECERSQEANLAQSLHLLNSNEIQGKLTAESGRATKLATDAERSDQEKIAELYAWVYSRPPDDEELAIALGHLEKTENNQQAYEDILWALVNTKEFLFNH